MPAKKPPKINHSRLLPVSPIVTKLLKFFSHHWDFILKREGESWYTETRYILNPRNFESYWQDPKISLGLRFGSQTKFGCLDLDKNSANNPLVNPKHYRKLIKALRKIGIKRIVLIRSSSNPGVHVFFFLPEGVNSFDLACALFRVLSENGFEIKAGQLEIFPNTKRYKRKGQGISLFNGLRVPMQPESGATLLDPKTFEPVPGGAEKFVWLMERSGDRQNFELLRKCCGSARQWYYSFALDGKKRNQWQKDLEYRLRSGFTASGQTNDILKDLANLGRVFYEAYTVSDLAKFIHERVIDLPGYLDHCGHQDEIEKRAFQWATSAINYWSVWASYPQRTQNFTQLWAEQERLSGVEPEVTVTYKGKWGLVNQKRSDETMVRLKIILAEYPLNTMPRRVGKRFDFINEKCIAKFGTRFSRNTLKKAHYRCLWHPKYTQEPIIKKKPGFSFKLAMECFKASVKKIVITIETLLKFQHRTTDKKQTQIKSGLEFQKMIAHKTCSTKQNDLSKSSVIQITQRTEKNDRTLMKCCVVLTPYLAYRVFILKFELVKEKLNQQFKKLLFPAFKTSDAKFKEIRRVKQKNCYFYHGVELSSRSALSSRSDKLVNLKPGTKVKITADYHSSSLSDDNRQILVYVKPIKVKTREQYLVPLTALLTTAIDTECYFKAILPRIKDLLSILGLTKEDYLRHIQQVYGVEKIVQLCSQQIFETTVHLQDLVERLFCENSVRSGMQSNLLWNYALPMET